MNHSAQLFRFFGFAYFGKVRCGIAEDIRG